MHEVNVRQSSLWEVAEEIRDGRLVPLLLDPPPEPASLSMLYPHRRLLPANVKVFADFAVSRFAEEVTRHLEGLRLESLRQTAAEPANTKARGRKRKGAGTTKD